jgi:glutamate/tyrosine decarboxylase-like PLP-dependent enzyme
MFARCSAKRRLLPSLLVNEKFTIPPLVTANPPQSPFLIMSNPKGSSPRDTSSMPVTSSTTRDRLQMVSSHLGDSETKSSIENAKSPVHSMISPSEENTMPDVYSSVSSSMLALLQSARTRDILPSLEQLSTSASTLETSLPSKGHGLAATTQHILNDIVPAVSSSSLSSRYFGFVTGGVTPAARLADYVASTLDECLAVRIPNDTIASNVEQCAISMLSELLCLDEKNEDGADVWTGSFTPGSSTSNLYGIGCGREYVLQARGAPTPGGAGIAQSCQAAGIREIQLLCSMAHPSIIKAASLLGLGRAAVKQLGMPNRPWCLDLETVERELSRKDVANIVSVGMGEVNSGKLGITQDELMKLRELCSRYQAWLHVDAGKNGILDVSITC